MQLQHICSKLHCIAISFRRIRFGIGHQHSLLFFPPKLQNIVLPTSSEAEHPEVTCLSTCFLCLSLFPRLGRAFFYVPFLERRDFYHVISSSSKGRLHSLQED